MIGGLIALDTFVGPGAPAACRDAPGARGALVMLDGAGLAAPDPADALDPWNASVACDPLAGVVEDVDSLVRDSIEDVDLLDLLDPLDPFDPFDRLDLLGRGVGLGATGAITATAPRAESAFDAAAGSSGAGGAPPATRPTTSAT